MKPKTKEELQKEFIGLFIQKGKITQRIRVIRKQLNSIKQNETNKNTKK